MAKIASPEMATFVGIKTGAAIAGTGATAASVGTAVTTAGTVVGGVVGTGLVKAGTAIAATALGPVGLAIACGIAVTALLFGAEEIADRV